MTRDDGLGDALLRVEPPRDRWGRVLLPGDDGKSTAYTRATTLAKALSGDKPALTMWKVRLAMHGVVANRTLHNMVAVTPLTEKATLNEIAERALAYAGADDGRTKGSTLHTACARVVAGGVDLASIPEDMRPDVSAYVRTLAAAGVRVDPELIERMVVNDLVRSAGSFDDVVTVDGLDGGFVFDLKSAQGGEDGSLYSDAQDEIEIQLAIYANANLMVPKRWVASRGRAQFEPPPVVSKRWAIVAHLAAGSGVCTLHWVDIARGWERAKLAFKARERGTGFLAWGAGPARAAAESAGIGTADPLADRMIAAPQDLVAESPAAAAAYDEAATAEIEAAKPARKPRRSRAQIERDAADAAKVLMPALDAAAAGDRVTVDPYAVGDTMIVAGVAFTKVGDDPFNPPTGTSGGALDTAALAVDPATVRVGESLAERDRRVRDEVLAERKRARIDAEIRAAIDDAAKPGTTRERAREHLALAYTLWESDWTDAHTAYGMERLAKL